MKKLLIGVLAVIATFSLVACGNKEEVKPSTNNEVVSGGEETTNETENNTASVSDDKYQDVENDYKSALAEFNLENIDAEEKITEKYSYVNPSLIAHIARYKDNGTEVSFASHDIDKNGVEEFIVGASGSLGAIYSYDNNNNKPVKIFFQDTMERGTLAIYDNGVILSSGAGGAALHYYEFGKIASDGITYELLEAVEEEYVSENETPIYKDAKTGNVLDYKSLDEIMNKYVADAKVVEL